MSDWKDVVLSDIENRTIAKGKFACWFLGGAGFVLKNATQLFYIDPYFGGSLPELNPGLLRMIPVPLNASSVRKADAVLVTHEHPDHCHQESLEPIYRNTNALFIAPEPAAKMMLDWGFNKDRVKQVTANSSIRIGGTEVDVLESFDPISQGAVMYAVESDGNRFLHSGDTRYFEGFVKVAEKYKIDVALINFGKNPSGMQLYMTPCDFLRTVKDLKAKKAVPMHWDIWKYTRQEPSIIRNFLEYFDVNAEVLHLMDIGDSFVYPMNP